MNNYLDDIISFQNGVDTIYNGCITYGSTPTSKTPSAIVTAISNIYTNRYNSGYNTGYTNGYNAGGTYSDIIHLNVAGNVVAGPTYSTCSKGSSNNNNGLFTITTSGTSYNGRSPYAQVVFNTSCSIIMSYSTTNRGGQTNASTKITLNDTVISSTADLNSTTLNINSGDVLKCSITLTNSSSVSAIRTLAVSIAVS